MNDSVLIWEKYSSLHEANLISKDPLHLELEKLLKEKNVQKPEIINWFLKTYIKWFQSPADDNQKTQFVSNYQAKETDPDWAKREGIVQFNSFTPEYKDRLSHLIDFLNTKIVNPKQYKDDDKSDEANEYRRKKLESDAFFKSLFKVTVPQMFEEVQKWDEEMERSSEKAKKSKLQSVEGVDYEVVGVYDGYPVWKLTSNKSFREESMYMGHCVGQANEAQVTSVEGGESTYFKEYKQGELIIYSLRDPKKHNHPVVTFRLQKFYGENNFKINEIKGPANRSVSEKYRKSCREFIEDNNYEVIHDGGNIGMIKWNHKFYSIDSKKFNKIYKSEIEPIQKEIISDLMQRVENNKIYGDVDLSGVFFMELPDLTNIKCEGNFDCSNMQLTTLKGAPQYVRGSFKCHNNQLTTLEGAPQYVGFSFSCHDNQLTTLEGAPYRIGGGFNCINNTLTTLEGAPQYVGGGFNCAYNQLTTLKGAPHYVGGTFDCDNNKLTTLKEAPYRVGGAFKCAYNKLISLEGLPYRVGDINYFDFTGNLVKFWEPDIKKAMETSRQRNQPKLESFKQFFLEACWKGYKQVGMKKKGKKKVPNCVPK